MRPLTDTRPKGLLPVAGKPILDYVLKSLKRANISDVTLVVGYHKEDIKERFGDGSELDMDISYVEQPEQRGTAHAISFTDIDETFVVINGDVYCDASSLRSVVKDHKEKEAVASIGTYRVKNAASYGVMQIENGEVQEIIEKPEDTSDQLINAGVYVFEPEIYETIKETPLSEREEKEITTSIELLIEEGELVSANELDSWVHVGGPGIFSWLMKRP